MICRKTPLFHFTYLWFHYLHSNTYNACISVYHSIMVRQEKKFPLFPLDGAVSVSSTDTTTPWTEATAIRSSAYVQSCGIGAKQRSIRCVGGGRGLDAGGESEWWQRCCSLSLFVFLGVSSLGPRQLKLLEILAPEKARLGAPTTLKQKFVQWRGPQFSAKSRACQLVSNL